MGKLKKIVVSCLLGSCALFSIFGFTSCGSAMVTEEYKIEEAFENIAFDIDTADINIFPSTDGTCKVVCYERSKEKHTVSVENGTLTVSLNDVEWYNRIQFFSKSPKITMYLPVAEYNTLFIDSSTGDVEIAKDFTFNSMNITLSTADLKCYASVKETANISNSTGDITVENVSVGALNISLSTGDVNVRNIESSGDVSLDSTTGDKFISNITCKNFFAEGSTGKMSFSNMNCDNVTLKGTTGDVELTDVIATMKLSIELSTGDTTFERCDAGEILVNVTTGNVEGSLLSEKIFITNTSTGKVNVPECLTGGKCKITTSTGDIKITIVE